MMLAAAAVAIALLACVTAPAHAATPQTILSPDQSVPVTVLDGADGSLTYQVTHSGFAVIEQSRLGIVTVATDLSTGLTFSSSTTRTVSQTYDPIAKTNGQVNSSATKTTLNYTKGNAKLSIIVRAQSGGFALQYAVSGVGSTTVTGEATTFALPTSTSVWAMPYTNTFYEGTYQNVSVGALSTNAHAGTSRNLVSKTIPVLARENLLA
jgi:alpha-glucosidase